MNWERTYLIKECRAKQVRGEIWGRTFWRKSLFFSLFSLFPLFPLFSYFLNQILFLFSSLTSSYFLFLTKLRRKLFFSKNITLLPLLLSLFFAGNKNSFRWNAFKHVRRRQWWSWSGQRFARKAIISENKRETKNLNKFQGLLPSQLHFLFWSWRSFQASP